MDAVAVSFLIFLSNPAHEEMVLEALQNLPDSPFISISSRVIPEFREYERTSTVVVNSYVGQVMGRYLGGLEQSWGRGSESCSRQVATSQPGWPQSNRFGLF